MRDARTRRGVVLLAVLVALVVVGALVTASAARVREDVRAVARESVRLEARDAAEGALWRSIAGLPATDLRAMPAGGESAHVITIGQSRAIVRLMRAGARDVWIVSTATITRGAEVGRDRVGVTLVLPDDPADTRFGVPPGPAFVVVP